METAHTITRSPRFAPAYLALMVVIACLILFSLDHETTSFWMLFQSGNLITLLFYFLPTWVLTVIIYELSLKYRKGGAHLLFAAVVGISLAFVLIILSFLAVMSLTS